MNTGRMIKVTFRNEITKEFPIGTSLNIISKSFQNYFSFPIPPDEMYQNYNTNTHICQIFNPILSNNQ